MNRRVFLLGMVPAGAVLLATGLVGCGGGTDSKADVGPYAGDYTGTYTRTAGTEGGTDETDIAEIHIYKDRQPESYSYPAIDPGAVLGFLGRADQPTHSLLGGKINSRGFLRFGINDGTAEGTLTRDPETGMLTGTFPLKATGTNADIGTISLSLTKTTLGGGSGSGS